MKIKVFFKQLHSTFPYNIIFYPVLVSFIMNGITIIQINDVFCSLSMYNLLFGLTPLTYLLSIIVYFVMMDIKNKKLNKDE